MLNLTMLMLLGMYLSKLIIMNEIQKMLLGLKSRSNSHCTLEDYVILINLSLLEEATSLGQYGLVQK